MYTVPSGYTLASGSTEWDSTGAKIPNIYCSIAFGAPIYSVTYESAPTISPSSCGITKGGAPGANGAYCQISYGGGRSFQIMSWWYDSDSNVPTSYLTGAIGAVYLISVDSTPSPLSNSFFGSYLVPDKPYTVYIYYDGTNYYLAKDLPQNPITTTSCFSHNSIRTLALQPASIIVKSPNPHNVPLYKIGDYELTYNHAIAYHGKYTTWQYYVDRYQKANIILCDQPSCKYLYNVLGHPLQQRASNILTTCNSLAIYALGGENAIRIWSRIIAACNNTTCPITIIENIDDIDDTHDIPTETYYLYVPKWSQLSATKQRMVMGRVISTMRNMRVFIARYSRGY